MASPNRSTTIFAVSGSSRSVSVTPRIARVAILTDGSSKAEARRSHRLRGQGRLVALQVEHDVLLRALRRLFHAIRARGVIRSREARLRPGGAPPTAMRSSSVATTTRSTRDAPRAASTTQAIMGRPRTDASGFPGKRVDAQRAGITARTLGLRLTGAVSTLRMRGGRPSPPAKRRERGGLEARAYARAGSLRAELSLHQFHRAAHLAHRLRELRRAPRPSA